MKPTTLLMSRRIAGFTLIELMITCAILAIIVGVAVPAYTYEMHKSRRTDARNAILDLAGREERFLSVSASYSQTPSDMGYSGATWPQNVSPNNYYNIQVVVPAPGFAVGSQTYLITATAQNQQASDTACSQFTVNQQGTQIGYNSAAVVNTTTCWGN